MKHLFFLIGLFISFSVNSQNSIYLQLSDSAIKLVNPKIIYDPSYFSINYPNGDVPSDRGVCTDVIIRVYRMFDIDLQKRVHEDMKSNFSVYPNKWGLSKPDKNIDHRRVPNLMRYFERHGTKLEISDKANDYLPGHIVCWDLGKGITHIGIVVNQKSWDKTRYLILHNIGQGQVIEDILFKFKIIGHYKYSG